MPSSQFSAYCMIHEPIFFSGFKPFAWTAGIIIVKWSMRRVNHIIEPPAFFVGNISCGWISWEGFQATKSQHLRTIRIFSVHGENSARFWDSNGVSPWRKDYKCKKSFCLKYEVSIFQLLSSPEFCCTSDCSYIVWVQASYEYLTGFQNGIENLWSTL